MENCIFCQIRDGKIPGNFIYQDDGFMVIRDIHPAAPVHLLVIPKKHVKDVMDVDDELSRKLLITIKKTIQEQKIRNFRLVHNGGGAALIEHLHVHIMGQVDKDRGL